MTYAETKAKFAKAKTEGQRAEARIRGILRGGFVYDGLFIAMGSVSQGIVYAPLAEVSELHIR